MFILAPSTILNPGSLKSAVLAKRMLGSGRIPFMPRRIFVSRVFWRLSFESSVLRHLLVLLPIPVAMLLFPHLLTPVLAIPPLLLFLVLYIEGHLAPVKGAKADAADQGLDLLNQRGRALLTRLAAGRGLQKGRLVLVVEQSAMARMPALTLVSVQVAEGPAVLDVTPQEQKMLREGLFDAAFSEGDLLRINLAQKTLTRSIALEASSISAHARLAGMARKVSVPG